MERKKEILHVAECFAGGVYDFINTLVTNMPEFSHTVLYGKREDTKENFEGDFPENIKFIYWKNATRELSPKKDFLASKELYRILSKKNYDAIHLHSSKAGFIGRVVGRLKGQQDKVVYTTHGVSFARCDIGNLKKNIYVLLEKIGSQMGGKAIACSKSEMELMKKSGLKRSDYIFNGVDLPKGELLPKCETYFNIVTVGRIATQKNPILFNEIAEKFKDNQSVKFKWIGDGEQRDVISSPNIEITGWLKKDEVLKELTKADIYLSTSLWEGLPLSVLQAMSVGLPLVLSDCIGNKDLISQGENGFIYKTVDEATKFINYLIEDENSITKYGIGSIEILKKKFSRKEMKEKYEEIYRC